MSMSGNAVTTGDELALIIASPPVPIRLRELRGRFSTPARLAGIFCGVICALAADGLRNELRIALV
jgi:folate-dependent tRNA-U54 methylase TrmFO/GidA